jgi:predicted TIM-barrel fold metal-dependent hydrolase
VTSPLADIRLRDFHPTSSMVGRRTTIDHPAAPLVDVHNHLGRWHGGEWEVDDVPELLDRMAAADVATIVNLDGGWGDELEANLDRYDRAHPGRFLTFARVDWSRCAEDGWGERLAESLADSARRGASGLKVWKDVGLRVRDASGELVFLDDSRLTPLWDVAAETGTPILVHTADPVAFFQPLDGRNERLEELLEHPDWHFHGPEFPPLSRLLEAFEAMIAANPGVSFIGAHVGCLAEDLDWVSTMLDRYPNFSVDIAARIAELGRQPRRTRELVERHPTRLMLGTDCFPPRVEDYRRYVHFLESADESFPYDDLEPPSTGRWTISGLALDRDLAAKVEGDNARALLPALATHG